MNTIEVRTQSQFDAALKLPHSETCIDLIEGIYNLVTRGVEAPCLRVREDVELSVVAWDSSQPRVEAWESSQPRVVAWDSSQPRVAAWDSSQPRVEAWESSQPGVVAWGSSQPRVAALDSSQPRVVAREGSQPRVVAWDSSQPRVVALDSSQPRVEAWESSQPGVAALDSSQPRVVAWGSSQPRVEARESSQPRVVAWDSSQPRVEARDSSQPRVEASALCQLSICGAVIAKCSAKVAVLIEGKGAKVTGGRQVLYNKFHDGKSWCDYYGVPVEGGKAVLYKVVNQDFKSPRGLVYPIGGTVESDGWDALECSKGLHFSPCVDMAREFYSLDGAKCRYLACEVEVKDLLVFPDGEYPNKAKAPSCKVLYEVDEDGVRK